MKEPSFAERLKAEKHRRHWRQHDVAKAFGISLSYASKLEAGIMQPNENMLRELEAMETAPIYDKSQRGDIMRDVKFEPLRYIPVISWAQAGVSVDFEELPKDWQDRIPTNVKDPKAVAVEIRGDSMEPYFRAGDRVILLPSQEPQNGDIVVAKFRDDGIALKLYHEKKDGRLVNLASYNTLYPPQDYAREAFEWIIPCDSVVKKLRH